MRRAIAFVVGLGLLTTWAEITEQHYFRARFAYRAMYLPVALVPVSALAALLRALSSAGPVRACYQLGSLVAVAAGLLGAGFHWSGNLRKYREKAEQGQLPGETDSEEDRKHGRPAPDVEIAGYNIGQLLEVGARGRPWLAPLALAGLGILALLAEREDGRG